MKIPTGNSGNGYYGYESLLSDGVDIQGIGNGNNDLESPTNNGDFSEYMWMENEEEFDKQVLQQLEEEALMEECMEAMLEDEREIRNLENQQALMAGGDGPRLPWSSTSANNQTNQTNGSSEPASTRNNDDLSQNFENLRVHEDLARQSTLNPYAAEFVPLRVQPSERSTSNNAENSS